jgi:hypothetical protein
LDIIINQDSAAGPELAELRLLRVETLINSPERHRDENAFFYSSFLAFRINFKRIPERRLGVYYKRPNAKCKICIHAISKIVIKMSLHTLQRNDLDFALEILSSSRHSLLAEKHLPSSEMLTYWMK